MVNGPSSPAADRRERPRQSAEPASAFGAPKLNPFGDLHTMQHLSARFARTLRMVFEPLLRREIRTWAEPLVVQRFADYRAERPEGLTAWLPLSIAPSGGTALAVFEARFVLEILDLFFGGSGTVSDTMPGEFSPAAEAVVARMGRMIAEPLAGAWEPLAQISFTSGRCEANPTMLAELEGDDAMVVTRFGIGDDAGDPRFIDLVYPVTALRPHTQQLKGKVHGKAPAEIDPTWRNGLTRATMGVRFPVRSVLAEPVISLERLMALQVGDVLPVTFGTEVPIMVGGDRFATGTVGTSNGQAAIRINKFVRSHEEDYQ